VRRGSVPSYRDYLSDLRQAELLLDWHHLAKKCRDHARAICPDPAARVLLLQRLFRWLWGGDVSRAVRVLARLRPQVADPAAVDDLSAYLHARAEWIPNYRLRRRQRRFIGNGLGEKANDRIVARRQKRKGMQWSGETSDALAALRTLLLNDGWEGYWTGRSTNRCTWRRPDPSASARLGIKARCPIWGYPPRSHQIPRYFVPSLAADRHTIEAVLHSPHQEVAQRCGEKHVGIKRDSGNGERHGA